MTKLNPSELAKLKLIYITDNKKKRKQIRLERD